MNQTLKRRLTILLCAVMLLSLLPIGATAAITPETDVKKILTDAYNLVSGDSLDYTATLTGKITSIKDIYSPTFGNISVWMEMPGYADQPILAYRVKGEGAKDLQVGDTITVTGSITNYNGSVQFAQGCTLDNVVEGSNVTAVAPSDPKQIVDAAYTLAGGAVLPYEATLTGKLTEIVEAYSEQYGNITVKLVIEGREDKPILCYRMRGNGGEFLKVGDTITVTGNLKNYVKTNADTGETTSTIEFSPCTLAAFTPGSGNGSDYTGPNFPRLYSLAVVGSGLPGISEWTPGDPAGDMNQVSYGVYVKYLICSAGTSMKLKIQGNDVWDDSWNFGSATLILGQKADLENSGGSREMPLSIEKDCTIKITVDLNPLTYGGAATILVEEVTAGGNTGTTKKVTLSVKVPESWTKVYAYSWDSTGAAIMGDWPGAQILKSGDWYKGLVNGDVNNLIINNGFMQSEDLYIQNGKDVWVVVSENIDGNYKYKATVTYTEPISKPEPEPHPGDINGDDKLNIGDVSKLYAHVRGTNTLSDPDVLARADVSGDGKLNIADVSKLYAYVRGVSPEAVVDAAYRLQENAQMAKPVTLTGTVTEILEPYNSKYKAVTLVMQIDGRADKPIICSRLRGEDAAYVMAGDTVTVTGILQNYYGSVEFAEGCSLDKWVDVPSPEEAMQAVVDAAYQLPENTSMDHEETLTGEVISIEQSYNSSLPYISITMAVPGREDKAIGCYRLIGEEIFTVKVGDTVTVTGTLRNYYGTVEFAAGCKLERVLTDDTGITVETDPAKIMAAAGKLAENTELPYEVALSGKVISVDDAYDPEYQNVTVTITVSDANNQPLKLYRLKGDGVDQLAQDDVITVKGKIKNHYGTIEMVNGTMTARTSSGKPPVVQTDYKKIVDEAYALQQGASLAYTATLQGRITELQSPYDAAYGNMTLAIVVVGREDKPIVCYRMKGDSIGNHLCVGDTITVEGKIKNYNGTIEFDSGCQMTNRTPGSISKPSDPKKIVDAAFALAENTSLPYFVTLTGVVKSIDEPYTDQYKNVTLTMTVQGSNGAKEIKVYRMKGNDAANVAVGNTITVTGVIKNYVGTDKETGEKKPPVIEFESGCFLETLRR